MQVSELEEIVGEKGIWNKKLFPAIKDVVFKTLKGVQESQTTDNKGRCFEVYGFDIMLDEQLNPWVIEVNLSPACRERETFLSKMLDDMAFDLFSWLERKILTNNMLDCDIPLSDKLKMKRNIYLRQVQFFDKHEYLNMPEFYTENGLINKYVRLQESIEEVKAYNRSNQVSSDIAQTLTGLELCGTKVDMKVEKKIDLAYRRFESTCLI